MRGRVLWAVRLLFAVTVAVEVWGAVTGNREVLSVSALVALALIAINHGVVSAGGAR
ncbi:hypothetical protein ACWGN5_38510 [Streptomyces sp. NPDC055815]